MLAREYDNVYEEEPREATRKLHFAQARQEIESDKSVLIRLCVFSVLFITMLTYGVSVWRSATLMRCGQSLLTLQNQELQLLQRNKELKLEVEQLKGPERIMGFAETKLGLATARSNIYVYPTAVKEMNSTTYALSNK